MCGIIGYIGADEVVPVLLDGLRRLEYRGYDSAGIAVMGEGEVSVRSLADALSACLEVSIDIHFREIYGIKEIEDPACRPENFQQTTGIIAFQRN